ncbi:hypothetical protein ACFQI7_31575 [Paenibacillus allorhizosphaerae]|uniref:Flagellar protein n=1 Tax=Paenibacillus allorhizosphaerae TaxID=2849866 RepID=A0ABN7TS55_9BACL|nr:hypothetical protein [Paenibacillus allorhizosphaerae]CAG7653554.1 hypothetical protein PAECIP111802_05518 [Paenibacillus allorhizosphaerae]
MTLFNCSGCGKLLTGMMQSLCTDCLKSRIELAHQIKSFLQAHPNASIMDLYEQTGIPINKVKELLKQG